MHRSGIFLALIFLGNLVFAQANSTFLIEPLELEVLNSKNLVVIADDGPDLVINLSYKGTIQPDMRLKGALQGPGLVSPLFVDQSAESLKIVFTNQTFSDEGEYRLTGLRLEQASQVVALAEPKTTIIEAVSKLLVTGATVEEVSQAELEQQGFAFNEQDYRAVKFNINLVMGSTEVIETFNVLLPSEDELESLWKTDIEVIQNPFRSNQLFEAVPIKLHRNRSTSPFSSGIYSLETEFEGIESEGYQVYALLLVPGEMSYFKGHFNVAALVLNDTPEGFDVRVSNLEAEITLPDATQFGYPLKIRDQNGDPVRNVVRQQANGTSDSTTNANFLYAGEEGKASFLLTGEQPGMWSVQLDVRGEAELPQGNVDVTSSTTARVLVRSREFAVSFEHPSTVAELQDYDFVMKVFNKSSVPLEGLTVTLDPATLIGTQLQATTNPQQTLAAIPPGETGLFTFGMQAQVNGIVSASYHRIQNGSDSSLSLNVGVGNDGETLTPFSVAFPARFDEVVPTGINQAFRVYAKKLLDFAQTEPDKLPVGVSGLSLGQAKAFSQSISNAATFLDWVSADAQAAYSYDANSALIAMISTYLDNRTDKQALDSLRRFLLENPNSGSDLELAFSAVLQSQFSTMATDDLLTRLAYEASFIKNLKVMVIEGQDIPFVHVQDDAGNVMTGLETNKVRDMPFASLFRLDTDKVLIWTAQKDASVSVSFTQPLNGSTQVTALTANGDQGHSLSQTLNLGTAYEPTIKLNGHGELEVLNAKQEKTLIAERSNLGPRPFSLVGIRQLDPLVLGSSTRFTQLSEEDDFIENGRYFMLAFSEPVDMGSLQPLNEHLSINETGAFKAYLQSDPRLVLVVSSQIVGNNFPISYSLRGVHSKADGKLLNSGDLSGSFLGSDWLRGAYVRGRVTDHQNSDLSRAKVYLKFAGEDPLGPSGQDLSIEKRGALYFIDAVDVGQDGSYQIDFVKMNRRYLADKNKLTTESGIPSYKNTSQIVVVLEDDRYKVVDFNPITTGQEVQLDVVFNPLGTVWGEVRDSQGTPIANVPVYIQNQQEHASRQFVYTNRLGVYRADGIEMGPISVRSEIDGFVSLESGYLTQSNSPLRLDLLPKWEKGTLIGRVQAERNGELVPVRNAAIAYRPKAVTERNDFNVRGYKVNAFAIVYTDKNGYYELDSIPAGEAIVQTTVAGTATQISNVIVATAGTTTFDVVFTEARLKGGLVRGRVYDANGIPAEGVRVFAPLASGNLNKVTSDSNGDFEITPVLLDQNIAIQAYQAETGLRGNYFLTLTETSPTQLGIEIHLQSPTQVQGTYTNAAGNPMPYRAMRMFSTKAGLHDLGLTNQQGAFAGELETNSHHLWIVGSPDFPRITYQETYIRAHTLNTVQVRQWGYESLKASLIDGHGNPVIGQIYLESMLPDTKSGLGIPKKVTSHVYFSDLEEATVFKDINYGPVTIYGVHPILGTTQHYEFEHGPNSNRIDLRNITLSFPRSEPGRLHGFVYNADGTPAPAGTLVHATFSGVKASTLTNAGGYYNFESLVSTIQVKAVDLFAHHVDSSRTAFKTVVLNQNLNMRTDLILKGKGNVTVRVVDHLGEPVESGDLVIHYRDYTRNIPQEVMDAIGSSQLNLDSVSEGSLDEIVVSTFYRSENVGLSLSQPYRTFSDVPAGSVSVHAESGAGLAGFSEAAIPVDGGDIEMVVRLEAGSVIRGTFVDNLDQPIAGAQINYTYQGKLIGAVTSSSEPGQIGQFEIRGLPMRAYDLQGIQPETRFVGNQSVITSPFQPEPQVTLKLDPLGHIEGDVFNEASGTPAISANVILNLSRDEKLETATDELGHFRFENIPLGEYPIEVRSPFIVGVASGTVVLDQVDQTSTISLTIRGGYDLTVTVRNDDGAILKGEQVVLKGLAVSEHTRQRLQYVSHTNNEGKAFFTNLPLGQYQAICSISSFGKQTFEHIRLDGNQKQYNLDLTMPALFTLQGQVRDTLGLIPSGRVTVSITRKYNNSDGFNKTSSLDNQGQFSIPGIPFGIGYEVYAYNHDSGSTVRLPLDHLETDGLEKVLELELQASTTASGIVLDAQGNPVANAEVWINVPSRIATYTNSLGEFTLSPFMDEAITVFAKDPDSPRTGATGFPKPERLSTQLLAIRDQVIQLQPMFDIQGTVSLADGTPILGAEVTATNSTTDAQFQIPTQQNGYYFLEHLPAGDYTLSAYDIIRREHIATPPTVENQTDGALIQQDLTFQPHYFVAGRTYEQTDVFAQNAVVEIFRGLDHNGRLEYFLVDATTSNEDGFFNFATLYPGSYRIRVENSLQTLSKVIDFTLTSASRDDIAINLEYESSLLVSVKTPSDLPYAKGYLELLRGGRLWQRIPLLHDGTLQVQRVITEDIYYNLILNDGWIVQTGVFNLQPGPNFFEIIGPQLVTLSGQVVLQSEAGGVPFTSAVINGVKRAANLLSDGYFEIPQVPVNQPVEIQLSKGGASRSIQYAGFQQNTDLGTLVLNGGVPSITPVVETMIATSLPHTFEFDVTHPYNPGATLDPSNTKFAFGYLSGLFEVTTDNNRVLITLQPENATFERGEHQIRLNVAREDGLTASISQTVTIDPVGTTLVVNAKNGYSFGSFSQDRGNTWLPANDSNTITLANVAAAEVHLYVRDPFEDKGARLDWAFDPTQMVQQAELSLSDYAGLMGRVFLPDGITPAVNARISFGDHWEMTDANGHFLMDFIDRNEINTGYLHGELGNRHGAYQATTKPVHQQVLTDSDMVLHGPSTLEINAFLADGVTAVPNAELTITYPQHPYWHAQKRSGMLNEQGQASVNDVLATEFQVDIYDPISKNRGSVRDTILQEQTQHAIDVLMQPTYSVSGTVVDQSLQPLADVELLLLHNQEIIDSLTSDSSGQFSLGGISHYQSATLLAFHQGQNLTRRESLQDVTRDYDLGDWIISPDQAPQFSEINFPDFVFLGQNPSLDLGLSDDTALKQLDISLNAGVPFSETLTWERTQARTSQRYLKTIPMGDTVTPGTYTLTLTLEDHAGQITAETRTLQIIEDLVGPQISVTSPTAQQSYTEGDLIPFVVSASDSSEVSWIEIYWQDVLLIARDHYHINTELPAVTVDQDQNVDYLIRARDRAGNISEATVPVQILASNTTTAPLATLRFPLDNMPLPLSLPTPLSIPVQLHAQDNAGLQRYQILVEGSLIDEGWLFGQTQEHQFDWVLPEAYRTASTLTFTLRVWNVGDLISETHATVSNIEGSLYDATTPLNIAEFDQQTGNETIILNGGLHQIDGVHAFANVVFVNGAVLTQRATDPDAPWIAQTKLQVSGHFVMAPETQVNMDGKGYPYYAPFMPTSVYGAHAGIDPNSGQFNTVYGSPIMPELPGSNIGGGTFKLNTAQAWLAGGIHAQSLSSSSGGAIWLNVTQQLEGFGEFNVNGYRDGDTTGLSGNAGRVAIQAPQRFKGQVHIASRRNGAGTFYERISDATFADGYRDILTVKRTPNESFFSEEGATLLMGLRRTADIDVAVERNLQPTPEQPVGDVLRIAAQDALPLRYFNGFEVWVAGSKRTTVRNQDLNDLWLPANELGTVNPGDLIEVRLPLDELIVADHAVVAVYNHPLGNVTLADGTLITLGETPAQSLQVHERGELATSGLNIPQINFDQSQELGVMGRIETDSFTLGNQAKLVPLKKKVFTEWQALLFNNDLPAEAIAGFGYLASINQLNHAGQWQGSLEAFGSPYQPQTYALGTHLHLLADSVQIDGQVFLAPEQNPAHAGSLWLQAQTMSGSGQITANASQSAGRIALWVDDPSAFTGSVQAQTTGSGGAGTIYWRTSAHPKGRLIVDNGGTAAGPQSTYLLGLGEQIAAADLSGNSLALTALPDYNALAGLHLAIGEDEVIQIQSNSNTNLQLATALSQTYPTGSSFQGRHVLDELVLAGGASLASLDPIYADTVTYAGGATNATVIETGAAAETFTLSEGADTILNEDPGFNHYVIDGAQLVFNYPVQASSLTLTNNATVIYHHPININSIDVSDSTVICAIPYDTMDDLTPGVTAQSLSMTQSTWRAWGNNELGALNDWTMTRLYFDIQQQVTVDATSTLGFTHANQTTQYHDWYGTSIVSSLSSGGIRRQSNGSYFNSSFGSYTQPQFIGMGGAIHIKTALLNLDGTLSAAIDGQNTGGSVWLETTDGSGTGSINVSSGSFMYGGRIAIHYQGNGNFIDQWQLQASPDSASAQYSAGTIFLKSDSQTYGTLRIDQNYQDDSAVQNRLFQPYVTGITGPGIITLGLEDQDPDPLVIHDASRNDLPFSLAGQWVRFTVDTQTYELEILANTHNSLQLKAPSDGILPPAQLPVNTELQLILKLDRLEMHNGGMLTYEGIIQVGDIVGQASDSIATLHCQTLEVASPFTLTNLNLQLWLRNPDHSNLDLNLQDTKLWLNQPLQLANLQLENAVVAHVPLKAFSSELDPRIDLTVNNLTMDASSSFDVSGLHDQPISFGTSYGYGSPGIINDSVTYGSFMQPYLGGQSSGGGRIRLRANQIHNGRFLATGLEPDNSSSSFGSGGSIWITAQAMTGDIEVRVDHGDNPNYGGGGRIALEVDDLSQANLTTSAEGYRASGTVLIKTAGQSYGTLSIPTQIPHSSQDMTTPLPSFGTISAPAETSVVYDAGNDQSVIVLPQWTDPVIYTGYDLVIGDAIATRYSIIDHNISDDTATFTVAGQVPSNLTGTTLRAGATLNGFETCVTCIVSSGPLSLRVIDDNTAPNIGVFNLASNQTWVDGGANFEVNVNATDDIDIDRIHIAFAGATYTVFDQGAHSFNFLAPSVASDTITPVTLTAYDGNNNATQMQLDLNVLATDTTAPSISLMQPASLTAPAGSDLTVEVDVSDNRLLDHIDFTFDGQSQSLQTNQTSGTFVVHFPTTITGGAQSKTLSIDATDNAGNTSNQQHTITLDDVTPPAEVVNLLVNATADSLTWNWAVPADVHSDMAAIHVYVDQDTTPQVLATDASSYSLTGLALAATHQIRVTTVDVSGNESIGISESGTTIAAGGGDIGLPTAYYPMDLPPSQHKVVDFDRTDWFTIQAPHKRLNGKTSLTVALWAKNDTYSGGAMFDLLRTNNTSTQSFLRFQEFSSGFRLYHSRAAASGTYTSAYNAHYLDDQWHRIVIVADYDTGFVKIYMDNQEIGSRTLSAAEMGALSEDFNHPITLGGYASTFYAYRGNIQDFQIWNKAWDLNDIAFDYQNSHALASERPGTNLNFGQLIGRWQLNEGQGQVAKDSSGFGNDAIAVNQTINWQAAPGPATHLPNAVAQDAWLHQNGDLDAGIFGTAMLLDRSVISNGKSHAAVVTPPTLPDAWTLNAYFNLKELPSTVALPAKLLHMGDTNTLKLEINSQDQLELQWDSNTQVLSSSLISNNWYMVSLVYANNQLQAYLDGAPLGSAINMSGWSIPTGTWQSGGETAAFRLDELALWDSVLNSADLTTVQDAYTNGESLYAASAVNPEGEINDLQLTATVGGLGFSWNPPDWGQTDLHSGYHLYIDDSSSPITLAASATQYLYTGWNSASDLDYRISAVYGAKESTGLTGTYKSKATAVTPASLPQPESHWDLSDARLGADKLVLDSPNYMRLPNDTDLFDGLTETTVSMWFRGGPDLNRTRYLFAVNTPNSSSGTVINLYQDNQGRMNGVIKRTTGSSIYLRSGKTPMDQEWHKVHVVANWNTGQFALYIDGELVADATYASDPAGPIMTGVSRYLVLGTNIYRSYHLIDGVIQDAQVWQKAFTATDVSFDYGNYLSLATERSGTALQTTDLKAHWPISGGDNGLLDASGNGYNLLTNATNNWQTVDSEPLPPIADLVAQQRLSSGGANSVTGYSGSGLEAPERKVILQTPNTWQGSAGLSASAFFRISQSALDRGMDTQLFTRQTVQGTFTLFMTATGQLKAVLPDGTLHSAPVGTMLSGWSHLALTYAANADLTVFLNARPYLEISASGNWTDALQDGILGGDGLATFRSADAKFDEITLWNRVLTAAEIAGVHDIYQSGGNLTDALSLGGAQRSGDGFGDDKEGSSLPEGTRALAADVWELRDSKAEIQDLIVDGDFWLTGSELVVHGEIRARSLYLRDGAILTLRPKVERKQTPLSLYLSGQLNVDARSRIDLDGVVQHQGLTPPNLAHAGYALGQHAGELKGALLMPQSFGGGQAGGGAFYLTAQNFALNGLLSARGIGASAGGAVWLNLDQLKGHGTIDVSGGQSETAVAGGGRVAIYVDSMYRFSGQIITGHNLQTQGSLVVAKRDGSGLTLDRSFPLQHQMPHLPQAMQWQRDQVELLGRNNRGDLLKVTSQADLTGYRGVWVETGTQRLRILEVAALGDGSFLIQLDAVLTDQSWPSLNLVIQSRQPQVQPNRIPLVPQP